MTKLHAAEGGWQNDLLRVRGAGVVALVLCLALLWWGGSNNSFRRVSDRVSDFYQQVLPREVPRDFPALVVEIDQESLDKYGAWPWPRQRIAALTKLLFDEGALVVGYDIVFTGRDRLSGKNLAKVYGGQPDDVKEVLRNLPDPDEALVRLVGDGSSHVVLARVGMKEEPDRDRRRPDELPLDAEFEGGRPEGLLTFSSALSSYIELDEVALGHGLINAEPDSDGVLRRLPLVSNVGDTLMPSLALELVRVGSIAEAKRLAAGAADQAPWYDLSSASVYGLDVSDGVLQAVTIGRFTVPVEPDGTVRMHFTQPRAGRTVSAAAVLDGSAEPEKIARKLAIVAFTGPAIEDVVATPVKAAASGADVHAQFIEAIFYKGWLERPVWLFYLEWAVTIFLGVLAVWALPKMAPGSAVAVSLGAAFLVIALSVAGFAFARLLPDILIPAVGAGIPATVAMAGLLLATERRRQVLREERNLRRDRAREAGHIQSSMLPTAESLAALPASVDVSPFLKPAQEVGGDFYDVFLLDDNRLFFSIGDVAGKSISAALFMAVAKALSKSVVLRSQEPFGSVVQEISREIARENPDEGFVTALLGILDLRSGEVTLCNAGHDNPIVLHNDGTTEAFDMEGGPPFCVLEDYDYPVETLTLAPGELLVLITDGVTEAWSPGRELFGRERLMEFLSAQEAGAGTSSLVQSLVDEVGMFEAGQEPVDDLTVMAIRYTP